MAVNLGLLARLREKKVKASHVVIAALSAALALVVWFAWLYLHRTNPLEVVQAAVLPVRQPTWVATVYGENGVWLSMPRAVFADGGYIYVSDTNNHRVVVFDYNGRVVRKFGDTGDQSKRLIFPYGLAVVNGEVYVADAGLMKVAVFDTQGNFRRYFAEKVLKKPVGLVYHDGKFYFTDVVRHQVVVTDRDGKELLAIGKVGRKEAGEFYYPNGLAVGPDGRIYVADTNNSRVQVFDAQGKSLAVWQGDPEKGEGMFASPVSAALDKAGNLYVSDPLTQRVAVVDPAGKMLTVVQQAGPPDSGENLLIPAGIWIDSRQRLYVVDYGGSRLVIYDLK